METKFDTVTKLRRHWGLLRGRHASDRLAVIMWSVDCWAIENQAIPGVTSHRLWYKQWKVRSGCLEKFAIGNSRGLSDFPEGHSPEGKSDDPREFPRANFSDNH